MGNIFQKNVGMMMGMRVIMRVIVGMISYNLTVFELGAVK
jgi:hypothetical protein